MTILATHVSPNTLIGASHIPLSNIQFWLNFPETKKALQSAWTSEGNFETDETKTTECMEDVTLKTPAWQEVPLSQMSQANVN